MTDVHRKSVPLLIFRYCLTSSQYGSSVGVVYVSRSSKPREVQEALYRQEGSCLYCPREAQDDKPRRHIK